MRADCVCLAPGADCRVIGAAAVIGIVGATWLTMSTVATAKPKPAPKAPTSVARARPGGLTFFPQPSLGHAPRHSAEIGGLWAGLNSLSSGEFSIADCERK